MIKCMKTVTGEDLIGNIEVQGDTLTIDTPCVVVLIPTQENQFTVGLAPFLPFSASKKFTYSREHVVLVYEAADQLKNEYNRITGKGIVMPERPKLELV
jgi:hypothetical protein